MIKKPVLVIMAAGLGSRYGGLKQMDPVGSAGELLLDFSLYDGWRAGFERACCIISPEMEADFRQLMAEGAGRHLTVDWAIQDPAHLPQGFSLPPGRTKPWGTGHALLAAKDQLEGPFVVMNADDYYGPAAFARAFDFLTKAKEPHRCCLISYSVEQTLTDYGQVARGVCQVDEGGFLAGIKERTSIHRLGERIVYEEEGRTVDLAPNTPVSMNFFGFQPLFLEELARRFPRVLEELLERDPLGGEYFMPRIVDELIAEGRISVQVLPSSQRWHGVTYREDRQELVKALEDMKAEGLYPPSLWD